LLAVVAGLCLALGLLAEASWLCDLLTHFRWQYAALLLACGGVLVCLKHPRSGLAALLLGGSVLATLLLQPSPPKASHPTLKVVSFNVLKTNDRRDEICSFIEKENPDVVVLSEINDKWSSHIARLRQAYPHVISSSRKKLRDVVILSRHPIGTTGEGGFRKRRWAEAIFSVGGTTYRLTAVHTAPPTSAANSQGRNEQLLTIAGQLAGQPRTILCGDLNISPFSPWYAKMLETSGLTDTSSGAGFSPTWMCAFPPIAVPIDHILLSKDLSLVSRRVGPSLGSDHSPVIVELALSPASASLAGR
jgi:endonuclease/exonuclease/phosphatase (EEP) superfamily protein YafD